jgi:hypothetical protein
METTMSDLEDLQERLRTARERLITLRAEADLRDNHDEVTRLGGKIEGVNLALSYLRYYES